MMTTLPEPIPQQRYLGVGVDKVGELRLAALLDGLRAEFLPVWFFVIVVQFDPVRPLWDVMTMTAFLVCTYINIHTCTCTHHGGKGRRARPGQGWRPTPAPWRRRGSPVLLTRRGVHVFK